MEIIFITEEIFKEYSPVTYDTVVENFHPYILIAQKMYIERVLGKPLSDELKEQIKADDLTPENQALILQIAPALAFYAVYQGIPFHWAKIVNNGITVGTSENSSGLGIDDIAQLRRYLRDDAQVWLQDLISYLLGCRETYLLWQPEKGCGCDRHPIRNNR
jgi:hypothetical protein